MYTFALTIYYCSCAGKDFLHFASWHFCLLSVSLPLAHSQRLTSCHFPSSFLPLTPLSFSLPALFVSLNYVCVKAVEFLQVLQVSPHKCFNANSLDGKQGLLLQLQLPTKAFRNPAYPGIAPFLTRLPAPHTLLPLHIPP